MKSSSSTSTWGYRRFSFHAHFIKRTLIHFKRIRGCVTYLTDMYEYFLPLRNTQDLQQDILKLACVGMPSRMQDSVPSLLHCELLNQDISLTRVCNDTDKHNGACCVCNSWPSSTRQSDSWNGEWVIEMISGDVGGKRGF